MMLTASTLPHSNTESNTVRAKLHEIDVRYAWHFKQHNGADVSERFPRGSPALICRVRLRELEVIYGWRYGTRLPYNAVGLDLLKLAAHHIAHFGRGAFDHIVAWAEQWMPDLPRDVAEEIAERVVAKPLRYKAATLGWRLGLTRAERDVCRVTTIRAMNMTEADMQVERKRKAATRAARRRAEARAKRPARPEPLSETKPWEKVGMSRATWYRKGKPIPESRETKPRMQQEAPLSMERTPLVSRSEPPAQGAIRANKGTSFRVRPWYPPHIQAQAQAGKGWWRRSSHPAAP
jgi:hypothetical protein